MSKSRVREWGWVAFPAVRRVVFQAVCPGVSPVVCPVVFQAACPAARPAVPLVACPPAAHRAAALRAGLGTRTACWKRGGQKRVAR